MTFTPSPGEQLAQCLLQSISEFQNVAEGPGTAVVHGITPHGVFTDGQTFDSFVVHATDVLVESGRVYGLGDDTYFESGSGDERCLLPLAFGAVAAAGAMGRLANLLVGAQVTQEGEKQSLLPKNVVGALLGNERARSRLPAVKQYTRRPVFDADYTLRDAGWYPDCGVLVHGAAITPVLPEPYPANAGVLEHIPPLTRTLLRDFCWASSADLVNALGVMLSGLLVNRFVDEPHPMAIFDGNQKGVGKTLFVQLLGLLLDGVVPTPLPLGNDAELEKRLCANVREARSSIFFFDNARVRIESAVIEQNALAPICSFRILGFSENVTRTNTYLWVVTANRTSATEDLISRAVPVRLRYDGDTKRRAFHVDDLIGYVRARRAEILGELAGLVIAWRQSGMLLGTQRHRCLRWAKVIGGILDTAGLGHLFLSNLAEVEREMDEGLAALAALAEHIVDNQHADLFVQEGAWVAGKGKTPKDWVPKLRSAGVLGEAASRSQADTTRAGQFLSGKVDQSVTIAPASGEATATLRVTAAKANQRKYYFEVKSPVPASEAGEEANGGPTSSSTAGVAPTGLPAATTGNASSPDAQPALGSLGGGNDLNWGPG